jgi:hypothetical protein
MATLLTGKLTLDDPVVAEMPTLHRIPFSDSL